jgi:hypothetical protein
MALKRELYKQLLELPRGMAVIHYLENKLALPPDGEITAAYHNALRAVCWSIAQADGSVSKAADALAFLDEHRPYSARVAVRRPAHYWRAAEPWASAVLKAAWRLPRVLRPVELLRQAQFVAVWTKPQVVEFQSHTGTRVTAGRSAMTNRWSISIITEDGDTYAHPEPFAWGVLSAQGVELRITEYGVVDGGRVISVTLFRPTTTYDNQQHCAATALLLGGQPKAGRWGQLYVAHGQAACELCDQR